MDDETTFEAVLRMRREVLGREHVGRSHELGLHVRGALNNGATAEEIREALLQTAIYCGVPAALEAQRTAERVLAEEGAVAPGRPAAADGTGE